MIRQTRLSAAVLFLLLAIILICGAANFVLLFYDNSGLNFVLTLLWLGLWIVFARLAQERRGWPWVTLVWSVLSCIGTLCYLLVVVLDLTGLPLLELVAYWVGLPVLLPLQGIFWLFPGANEQVMIAFCVVVLLLSAGGTARQIVCRLRRRKEARDCELR